MKKVFLVLMLTLMVTGNALAQKIPVYEPTMTGEVKVDMKEVGCMFVLLGLNLEVDSPVLTGDHRQRLTTRTDEEGHVFLAYIDFESPGQVPQFFAVAQ